MDYLELTTALLSNIASRRWGALKESNKTKIKFKQKLPLLTLIAIHNLVCCSWAVKEKFTYNTGMNEFQYLALISVIVLLKFACFEGS